jgi:hypothetical protein
LGDLGGDSHCAITSHVEARAQCEAIGFEASNPRSQAALLVEVDAQPHSPASDSTRAKEVVASSFELTQALVIVKVLKLTECLSLVLVLKDEIKRVAISLFHFCKYFSYSGMERTWNKNANQVVDFFITEEICACACDFFAFSRNK